MWGLMRDNFCRSPHVCMCARMCFLSTAMTGSKNNLTWLAKPSQSKPKTQGIVELLMKSQLDFMPDQPASQPANQPTSHPVTQPSKSRGFLPSCSFGPSAPSQLCRMQSQCATRWQEKQGSLSAQKRSN